jgi:hypothetical protein
MGKGTKWLTLRNCPVEHLDVIEKDIEILWGKPIIPQSQKS